MALKDQEIIKKSSLKISMSKCCHEHTTFIFIGKVGAQKTPGVDGGAMVLGKRPVLGRPTIRITVGQESTALAVGAGGGCLDFFYSHLSFLS